MSHHSLVAKLQMVVRLLLALILVASLLPVSPASAQTANVSATAVVLVNSSSTDYLDFSHYVQPYLDNFGVPYSIVDIATTPVPTSIGDKALLIIGHRGLDRTGSYLDTSEQNLIVSAVNTGTGLINFDNDLWTAGGTSRYQFLQTIFGFSYNWENWGANITFTQAHYITDRHQVGSTIGTGGMTLAGITLPASATSLATIGGQPLLAVTTSGSGRAVQWGSYGWMSTAVKGPMYGLDDLVWRGFVWAARKPFVMQGMPPFVTMRVDDSTGPFDWIHTANQFGLKPWAGLFYKNISSADAADLSALVNAGRATASVHSTDENFFFYWNNTDAQMAANYADATAWHQSNNVPISKFVLAHYYDFGTNAFAGLQNWGVQYIGTLTDPGVGYGGPWVMNGPYRFYETGSSQSNAPVYYADYIQIPGHPEYNNQFFNCLTEIRDDAGYEWYPTNDVTTSVGNGTRQTKRALDSMAIGTLFTHYQSVGAITSSNWQAILQGVTANLASYNPMYVTLDYACQYARAAHNSSITASAYDPAAGRVTTTFGGSADIATKFYVFADSGGQISQTMVDVPAYSGSTTVNYQLAGPLDHITVTPSPATVSSGGVLQFTAQGYDAANNPIPNLPISWAVTNSAAGTISSGGLFTAALQSTYPTAYPNVVTATYGSVQGSASVTVTAPAMDHFVFANIAGQMVNAPFTVTISAVDRSGSLVTDYAGQATLSASTGAGTLVPTGTGSFSSGQWTGSVTLNTVASSVTLTATSGTATGTSNTFAVSPGALNYIVVSPDTASVVAGATQQFAAQGYDAYSNPIPGLSYNWSVATSAAGTISSSGLFTAGSTPGTYANAIVASAGSVQDSASVTVTAPNLHHFSIDPIASTQYVGVPFPLSIAARDAANNVLSSFAGSVSLSDGTGTVSPAATGTFAGGRWVGDVTLGQTAASDTITVTFGSVSNTTNAFAVQAPPTFYQVTSPSYSQSAGQPFGVTVTAYQGTQIDLTNDSHQLPVLTTFTDPGLLNDHDGRWDEFQYVGRSFPAVFAAHGEWENYGLQPMHFFATGMPNGRYTVIANLYTGSQTRYFYGWTEAEARANTRYVDNVGGTVSEDFAEFSLGTVDITNGRFDLWAGNGDPLAPTYEYYGWAWARLVPAAAASATMTSNSPTMLFDGNGNGTFGEIGDNVKNFAAGTFTIPARDTANGTSIVITATDASSRTGSATYTIAGATNLPPVVTNPGNQTSAEGDVVSLQVVASDPDGNTLTYSATGLPAGLTINAASGLISGTVDYTAAASSPYATTVSASDGSLSASQSFTWTVNNTNRAPVAADQAISTNEDTSAPLILGASDADNDPLTYIVVGGPAHGTLSGSAPSLTYTPAPNYNGADSFTFRANDGTATSNTATVNITIAPVNDAPTFAKGADQTVPEDAGAQTVAGWATSVSPGPADEASQALNFLVSSDNSALFAVQPAIAANGTLTYTPAANANGAATVSVQLHDDGGTANGGADTSPAQSFTITVTPVNDAPTVVSPIANVAVAANAPDTTIALGPVFTDVDIATNADTLTYSVSANTNPGLITTSISAGSLVLHYALNQSGTASITVRATDSGALYAENTFTATVSAGNLPPVVTNPGNQTSAEGDAVSLQVVASDPDGNTLTYSATGLPAGLSINPATGLISGTIAYTAATSSPYAVSVTASDGAASTTQAFTWTVNHGIPSNAFLGEYYTNRNLLGSPSLTRVDSAINFNWGSGSPGPSIPNNNFSVRWTGRFTFTAGSHTFTTRTDDGVRLYVDGVLLMDYWYPQSATHSATTSLTSGAHEIKVEYFDKTGTALAQVSWR